MAELARSFVSRLRRFIGNRRRAKRIKVRLPFTVRLAKRLLSPNGARRVPSLDGHTLDISTSGLALIVPAIRIGEHYLVGEDRRLQLTLELPVGPVEMEVAPVRYESLEEHETETGYLIGVRIVGISDEDKAQYNLYIKRLLKPAPID
jgi:hypothetical protein